LFPENFKFRQIWNKVTKFLHDIWNVPIVIFGQVKNMRANFSTLPLKLLFVPTAMQL